MKLMGPSGIRGWGWQGIELARRNVVNMFSGKEYPHAPIVYVPRIGHRNDELLHQFSQILDRRTWTADNRH